jgi:hypothetical protein
MLRVRERAYQIWAANGGDADRNWLRAETEILHTSAAPLQDPTPQRKPHGGDQAEREETASLAGQCSPNIISEAVAGARWPRGKETPRGALI